MFTGSAPPSPPRPPKFVPKDQPTPPKAPLNDPLIPKTMELLRDNCVGQARGFVQYIRGLRAPFCFALRNPMCNPLVTWPHGNRICRSHFLSCSEERGALILVTLNPNHVPLLSRFPIPVSHPPSHFLPQMPTNLHLHRLIGTTPIASTYGHFDHLWKQITRDGQSKYTMLRPVPVPHRSTPHALSCPSINFIGRRSASAPVPQPDNAIPPRTFLLHPHRCTSLLPTAALADNQQTPRYSLLPHGHVALLPGVAQSASPQPSTVPVKRDGQ